MVNQQKFTRTITRRRGLGLIGSSVGMVALTSGGCTKTNEDDFQTWQGAALGAPASLKIYGVSQRLAQKLFALAVTEIERLENLFSLYKPQSEILRLNSDGALENASAEMLDILRISKEMGELTDGSFDITVQPLWMLADRLKLKKISKHQYEKLWANARALVDYRGVKISGSSVQFDRKGMGITLNGLAQGYITDKVCDLLQRRGAKSGLVNIGENKGFGPQVFRVAIQDPRNVLDTLEIINLRNQSLATSAPKGGYIQDGVSHIFRGNGKLERPHMSVSVTHQRAVIADALATAFVHMPVRDIGKIVRTYGGLYVALVDGDGRFIKPY